MVSYLKWDSKFFDLRVGKVNISSQEEMDRLFSEHKALSKEFDLIYILGNDGLNCPMSNAKLVDKKLVYTASINYREVIFNSHIVNYPLDIVSDDLLNLALASGAYSRFFIDKNFPINSYERLYTRWIEQSVKRVIATEVFCYIVNDRPRGLLTLKRDGINGNIGLVATDGAYRGKGIGSALLEYVLFYMYEKGCKTLNVVTQAQNTAACHLYEKVGFLMTSSTDIWHWWLNK